ncbi:MAG: type II toxin-antitoxin system RelE/ParE family toxin [Anaerolineae bacterium]|nr:type II toxin-antitoxin system RelE/ParE family toxin [Anaerolineae bacterium]
MPDVLPTEEFTAQVKRLRKKYPNIRLDLQPLIDQLENGETPGDRLQGQKALAYKIRLPNRDARRGKRGGYRVIYYVPTTEYIYLLTIYSKSDIDDIPDAVIVGLIDRYSQALPPANDEERP